MENETCTLQITYSHKSPTNDSGYGYRVEVAVGAGYRPDTWIEISNDFYECQHGSRGDGRGFPNAIPLSQLRYNRWWDKYGNFGYIKRPISWNTYYKLIIGDK